MQKRKAFSDRYAYIRGPIFGLRSNAVLGQACYIGCVSVTMEQEALTVPTNGIAKYLNLRVILYFKDSL